MAGKGLWGERAQRPEKPGWNSHNSWRTAARGAIQEQILRSLESVTESKAVIGAGIAPPKERSGHPSSRGLRWKATNPSSHMRRFA